MLPMPATQPAGSVSDTGVSRLQRHMKMSSKFKGNGKQVYKVMQTLNKRKGSENDLSHSKSPVSKYKATYV